jgi:hypothetical protein
MSLTRCNTMPFYILLSVNANNHDDIFDLSLEEL